MTDEIGKVWYRVHLYLSDVIRTPDTNWYSEKFASAEEAQKVAVEKAAEYPDAIVAVRMYGGRK